MVAVLLGPCPKTVTEMKKLYVWILAHVLSSGSGWLKSTANRAAVKDSCKLHAFL
jgi:hypothetical protein